MKMCSWSYKLVNVGLYSLMFSFLYFYPNIFLFDHARALPLLALDTQTPLVPWTFLIYVSYYVLIVLPVFLLNSREDFDAYIRMALGVLMVCAAFFVLFPTAYPRPPYPYVQNRLIAGIMHIILRIDSPGNCFPSMHVALSSVAVWALQSFRRKFRAALWLWLAAICLSTLTTKQHYLLDVVGGSGVAIIVIWLERFVLSHMIIRRANERKFVRQ